MNTICSRCLLHQRTIVSSSISKTLQRKLERFQQPVHFQSRWQFHARSSPSRRRYATTTSRNPQTTEPQSLADAPPRLVKMNRRHGPGLIILALIPLTAFALGTWQIYRLEWKTDLIARYEDRLVRPPLPLPVNIDASALSDFDYRRIYARGIFRHDLEMLVGPRLRDGVNGYFVVTPFERLDARGQKVRVLVNRGWIRKEMADQKKRGGATNVPGGEKSAGGALALPSGEVEIEGLLRGHPKGNMFTPSNRPETGDWFFPDVPEMARHTGSQAVWIEATMTPDLIEAYDREEKGVPIGRAAEVNLRNNHAQYIFTWYSLAAATSIMFWMVIRKPPGKVASNVRRSRDWV